MEITAKAVAELREKSGAGIMDCKKALAEANGDLEKALENLRKRGQKIAAKKSTRDASEGIVGSYIHSNKKIGAMVILNCETDFVAHNEEFQELAHDIAMQVVAMNPAYLNPKDVPEEIINKEKEVYKETLLKEGKPEEMLDKICEGKVQKFYQENCLIKQAFIKDDKKTIEKLVEEKIAKLGENIKLSKFVQFSL